MSDTDAAEVLLDTGVVVTCYRANMGPGHGWWAVWETFEGTRRKADRELTADELAAIRQVDPRARA
jgi:hypothetical protein